MEKKMKIIKEFNILIRPTFLNIPSCGNHHCLNIYCGLKPDKVRVQCGDRVCASAYLLWA
jgi:hypothetical protein